MTPGDRAAVEVEQGERVGGLLGPADQEGREAVEPGMSALDNPASRFGLGGALGPGFLTATAPMRREAELLGQGTRFLRVEAFVETQRLRAIPGRLGPGQRDRLQAPAHQ